MSDRVPDSIVYTLTFLRACEVLGGPAQLAHVLGVSSDEIEAWTAGHTAPPPGVFLRAIDLVTRHGWNPRAPAERG